MKKLPGPRFFAITLGILLIVSCKSRVKEQHDSLYSRHLQRKVDLKIISTALPKDKSEMNLCILLTGTEKDSWESERILDSLHKTGSIAPLLIVEVEGKASEEFGMSELQEKGLPGDKALPFHKFVVNELYPFIKKKATVRKFRSIAVAGAGKAGISALDLAWLEDEKFSKVAVFSGALDNWKRDQQDSSAILQYFAGSRKRPRLAFWFYAGSQADTSTAALTDRLVAGLLTKSFISKGDIRQVKEPSGGNKIQDWNRQLPSFLVWAFGR